MKIWHSKNKKPNGIDETVDTYMSECFYEDGVWYDLGGEEYADLTWAYKKDVVESINRLKEAESIIKKAIWYIERVTEFCEPIADESFLFCRDAKNYLNKYRVKK